MAYACNWNSPKSLGRLRSVVAAVYGGAGLVTSRGSSWHRIISHPAAVQAAMHKRIDLN